MRCNLVRHPGTSASVSSIAVEAVADDGCLRLTYAVTGTDLIKLPARQSPTRTDGLWRSTCFESFVATAAGGYLELNLSPSSQWAAYAFDAYRDGMRDLALPVAPRTVLMTKAGVLMFEAEVAFTDLPPKPITIGLSAVIEEIDGTKSYWALCHPAEEPDFHHPDSFALTLE